MLLFFYGQDGYRSFHKLQELKAKYVDASLGDTNLTTIDVASIKPEDLAAQLFALPFIAKTRLVVLPGLLSKAPKAVQEKFETLYAKIPESTVAVVYEPGIPDRRTALFKQLIKNAKVQEFEALIGLKLNQWIDGVLAMWQVTILPPAREQLVAATGGDTWRMATELEKLATFLMDRSVAERKITPELITAMVEGTPLVNIFSLTDALSTGNVASVVRQLRQLVTQGENEQYLIAMVGSTLRSLALIRDGLDQGATTPAALATITGLKPFVIQKQLAAAKAVTMAQVTDLSVQLTMLDAGLKNGTMASEVGLELYLMRATAGFASH
jgi:DNA polymerase III delta subunit